MYNLKLAIRNLTRQRSGTIINVIGLSLSLAVCLLIALFVQYEYSFEKHNPDADKIYRLLNVDDGYRDPIHPVALFQPLTDAIPELESGLVVMYQSEKFFLIDNEQVVLNNVIFSTNEFISFFKIDMIEGGNEPLSDVSSGIISRSLAEKLFPGMSPMGKTLRFENRYDFHVRGVFEDAPVTANNRPSVILNVHSKETLDPFEYTSMHNQSANFYFLLSENTNLKEIEEKIVAQAKISYGNENYNRAFAFQPLTDIHLHSSDTTWDLIKRSDAKMVQLFILVAVLLLLVATFNFINLSIALRNKRNFHTGMQKIMGAERKNIFSYLFAETSLLVGFCLLVALFLTAATLPHFNQLMDTRIAFSLSNPVLWGAIAEIALFNLFIPVMLQLHNQMKVKSPSAPAVVTNQQHSVLPR